MKRIQSIFLVFFLTACQSSLITGLVTQRGQALFQDDFSDPASGWLQATDANGTLGYDQGVYRIVVKSAGYDLRAVSGHSYRDVQIEVDATRQGGPLNNRLGLICRFQDMDNYYFFIISSDGYYAIGKIKNGEASLLGQEMMAPNASISQGEGINHLRFDCIGNTLKGRVNDHVIAITEDEDFTGGDAGLLSGAFDEIGVEVCFDNFRVIKP